MFYIWQEDSNIPFWELKKIMETILAIICIFYSIISIKSEQQQKNLFFKFNFVVE